MIPMLNLGIFCIHFCCFQVSTHVFQTHVRMGQRVRKTITTRCFVIVLLDTLALYVTQVRDLVL